MLSSFVLFTGSRFRKAIGVTKRGHFMGLGHKIYMDMKFSPPKWGSKMRLRGFGGHLTLL